VSSSSADKGRFRLALKGDVTVIAADDEEEEDDNDVDLVVVDDDDDDVGASRCVKSTEDIAASPVAPE